MVTSAHEYFETMAMVISLGLEKYLLGQLFHFNRKSKGHSPDMDLREDFSKMSLGWRLRYLDEHSHSPLLVYLVVFII